MANHYSSLQHLLLASSANPNAFELSWLIASRQVWSGGKIENEQLCWSGLLVGKIFKLWGSLKTIRFLQVGYVSGPACEKSFLACSVGSAAATPRVLQAGWFPCTWERPPENSQQKLSAKLNCGSLAPPRKQYLVCPHIYIFFWHYFAKLRDWNYDPCLQEGRLVFLLCDAL